MASKKQKGDKKSHPPISVGSLFLDSGAHSLWNEHIGTKNAFNRNAYAWFDSQEFWGYVDAYAGFVKENVDILNYYANVDVIYDPARSWKVLKYLEKKHKLKPVPVIHWDSDTDRTFYWLDKHLEAGYPFIGLGGLGQGVTKEMYFDWADCVFERICPPPDYLPIVRTHGFAMTAYDLMLRYPWWSVDSASWTKAGAFGSILVPHRRRGRFTFDVEPYVIAVSEESPDRKSDKQEKHYKKLSRAQKQEVQDWLALIGVPLGEIDKDGNVIQQGVCTRHSERKAANLLFFEHMRKSLPEYPWPFKRYELKAIRRKLSFN